MGIGLNLEKLIKDAISLGIDVQHNAENPGVFIEQNGKEIEVSPMDIFPELRSLEDAEVQSIILPKVEAYIVESVKINTGNNNNTFLESTKLIGAA